MGANSIAREESSFGRVLYFHLNANKMEQLSLLLGLNGLSYRVDSIDADLNSIFRFLINS